MGLCRLELLQHRDLAGVVELVLHDAAEHVKKIVILLGLARNLVLQTRVGKGGDRLDELVVSMFRGLDGLPPCSSADIFHRWEVLRVAKLDGLPTGSSADGIVPGCDMQQKFPDAVSTWDRLSRSGFCAHVGKKFENGIAVPGVAFEGAANLIGEADRFSHEESPQTCLVSHDCDVG